MPEGEVYIGTLFTESGREYDKPFETLDECWDYYVGIATGPNKTFIGYKINGRVVVIDGTCKIVEREEDYCGTVNPSRQIARC